MKNPKFQLSLCILFFALSSIAQESTLKVSGNAQLAASPEFITLHFGISIEENNYAAALQKMNQNIQRLTESLKSEGYKTSELKTSLFRVNQRYLRNRDQRDTIYVASQNLLLTLEIASKKLIPTLNAAIGSGANPSISIRFELDSASKEAMKRKLLTAAVRDAYQKAQIMVASMDYEIIRVKTMVEANGYQNPGLMSAESTMARSYSTDVSQFETEDLIFRQSVEVVYEIRSIQ